MYILLDKSLDIINLNSANTLDKTINISFKVFTAFKNDIVQVNFGDSFQQSYQLNSSI